MSLNSKLVENETFETLRARLRLGVLLFAFWVMLMIEAYLTFPFVQHVSKIQNLVYGFIVGIPFLVLVITYLVLARRDMAQYREKEPETTA
jgi:type III secretory pathway component EscU